jgi:hypothetical protein
VFALVNSKEMAADAFHTSKILSSKNDLSLSNIELCRCISKREFG